MKMAIEQVLHKGNRGGMAVAGMGFLVTGIGRTIGGTVGAGMIGFGLAQVALGLAEMIRPLIRE